ncbi:TerD family protein [Micromonosporaceae bacterium Da 78-11]
MTREMRRGSNVALTREIPGLTGLVLGVRVDAGPERALVDTLVSAVILCTTEGHAVSDDHFVFFNQLSTPEKSVQQIETALGGDHDQIEVDLPDVPPAVARIVLVTYLNEGLTPRRTLGRLRSCHVRVLDLADGVELVRSENLATGLADETGIALGEVYRHQGGWKFRVLGDGYADGIAGIARDYGVTL